MSRDFLLAVERISMVVKEGQMVLKGIGDILRNIYGKLENYDVEEQWY